MGPEASNGVTGSMGLRADLAPPAGPDPLIVGGLAALAPSSWDLDTPANGAPGAPFVMVANVSRQFGLCGSSVEALSDTTERDSVEAVRRSVWRMFRVWDKTTARWRASLPALASVRTDFGAPSPPPLLRRCAFKSGHKYQGSQASQGWLRASSAHTWHHSRV